MFWCRGLQHSCPGRSESKPWHNGLTCTTEVAVLEKEVPVEKLKMSDGTRQDTDRAPVHCSGGSSAGGHHGVSVTEKHADIQEDGLCAE